MSPLKYLAIVGFAALVGLHSPTNAEAQKLSSPTPNLIEEEDGGDCNHAQCGEGTDEPHRDGGGGGGGGGGYGGGGGGGGGGGSAGQCSSDSQCNAPGQSNGRCRYGTCEYTTTEEPCPAHSRRNTITRACECLAGFEMRGGICVVSEEGDPSQPNACDIECPPLFQCAHDGVCRSIFVPLPPREGPERDQCLQDCANTQYADLKKADEKLERCEQIEAPAKADFLCAEGLKPYGNVRSWLYDDPETVGRKCVRPPEVPTTVIPPSGEERVCVAGPITSNWPQYPTPTPQSEKKRISCQRYAGSGFARNCLKEVWYPQDCYTNALNEHLEIDAAVSLGLNVGTSGIGGGVGAKLSGETVEGLLDLCKRGNTVEKSQINSDAEVCEAACP